MSSPAAPSSRRTEPGNDRPYDRSIDLALLHGFAATSFTWRSIVPALSADGHHVEALDRPWQPLAASVDHTLAELERLGSTRVVLVGHSAGAEIAASVAATVPERVAGLVLEAPVIGVGPPRMAQRFAALGLARAIGPRVVRLGVRAALPRVLRRQLVDRSRLTPEVIEGYRRPLLLPGVAEEMWAMTAATGLPTPLRWSDLEAIPCLTIRGDRDTWTTPIGHRGAQEIVYERCGHLPHEEQPDRFVGDVRAFLAGLDSG